MTKKLFKENFNERNLQEGLKYVRAFKAVLIKQKRSVDSCCRVRTLKRKKNRILLQTVPQLQVHQQQNATGCKKKKVDFII